MSSPYDMLTAMDARQQEFMRSQQSTIETIREETRLRTIKYIDMPLVTGKASGSALLIGGDAQAAQFPATPAGGYVWHIRRLVIEGLTAGTTPDVVNLLVAGRIRWQLNGNQFAQTWGRGEMRLTEGQIFTYQSVGTFTSTNTIIISGTAEEVAAEQEGKFR